MKIFLLAIIITLFAGCTKTKIGTYTFIVEGSEYRVVKNAFCCDTTGTYSVLSYRTENSVQIHHVGNSVIEIGDNIWKKDGKSISLEIDYDSNNQPGHALGGNNKYKENYIGNIISNTFINGNYHNESSSYVYNGSYVKSIIDAKFTIRKN